MSLPEPGAAWPPRDIAPLYADIRVDDAWYSGDRKKLTNVYRHAPQQRHDGRRRLWGRHRPPSQREHRLHIPLAGEIAQTSADLLFADTPVITVGDTATQDRLGDLLDAGGDSRGDRAGRPRPGREFPARCLIGVHMPVSPDQVEYLAAVTADLYAGVERQLLELCARQLAAGLDAPGWAVANLAAVSPMRRAANEIRKCGTQVHLRGRILRTAGLIPADGQPLPGPTLPQTYWPTQSPTSYAEVSFGCEVSATSPAGTVRGEISGRVKITAAFQRASSSWLAFGYTWWTD
ncbi:hypothetical protein DF18_22760 [Streptomyces rimosus]|uniref:hypothetical protein n=1 Tax=Streptomyces rimosus TaxID=1927 RepID=UPI0004D4E94F|nr:hypothetical protein [Streptomyces rimosus]KEF18386.1 hypothetical protein DF18_22760 [Streptomyces rimosus]